MGKGTHRALDRAQYFARRYPYVLQCDVRQFFPSIDHEILRGLLTRHIACQGTMWLVDQILESGGFRCASTSPIDRATVRRAHGHAERHL